MAQFTSGTWMDISMQYAERSEFKVAPSRASDSLTPFTDWEVGSTFERMHSGGPACQRDWCWQRSSDQSDAIAGRFVPLTTPLAGWCCQKAGCRTECNCRPMTQRSRATPSPEPDSGGPVPTGWRGLPGTAWLPGPTDAEQSRRGPQPRMPGPAPT